MMKQKEIAKILKIDQTYVSRIKTGERKISLSLARRMAILFPYRDALQWKDANKDQFKAAFDSAKFGSLLENLKMDKKNDLAAPIMEDRRGKVRQTETKDGTAKQARDNKY